MVDAVRDFAYFVVWVMYLDYVFTRRVFLGILMDLVFWMLCYAFGESGAWGLAICGLTC